MVFPANFTGASTVLTCIFACTASKSLPPHERLKARSYTHLRPTEAYFQWSAALCQVEETTTAARLYRGGYWSVARETVRQSHLPLQAFVASAGIGLVGFNEPLPGYSATFSPGPDLIPGGTDVNGRRWWWKHLGGSERLKDLATHEDPRVVVALPKKYLEVALPDLLALQGAVGPRALSVFTTHTSMVAELGASVVPLEGRMSAVLGGTVGQLTARSVQHVLGSLDDYRSCTPGSARRVLEEVARRAPDRVYPRRKRQTEAEVRQWLAQAMTSDSPPSSASDALRRFRDGGLAFEQKNFSRLYKTVCQELSS